VAEPTTAASAVSSATDADASAAPSLRAAAVALVTFLLFAANFNAYRVFGDGTVPYAFVRRLFGHDDDAIGYQFGLALLEAPFYAVGSALSQAGLGDIQGAPVPQAMISLAANAFVVGAAALAWLLIVRLRLPMPSFAVFAAVFGSPLWYYGVFSPSYTHAADTLIVTAVLAVLLVLLRTDRRRPELEAGIAVLLALSITIRYFNGAQAAVLVAALVWLGRVRQAVTVAVGTVVTTTLLFLVPVAVGVPVFSSGYTPDAATAFTPLGPLRMLVTDHRGLFVWTPVTLLGAIGYVLLLRERRDDRAFLVTAASMAVALLLSYSIVPFWDGGWAFSQRYLTSWFPLVAIGMGGLLRYRRVVVAALASACIAWSVFLGLNHVFGASQDDGATGVAAKVVNGDRPPGAFFDLVGSYSRLKYVLRR
jgi:hypothetical protein